MKLSNKSKDETIRKLISENKALKTKNKELVKLCKEKDSFFTEMISDGLRHGSKLAGKHMSDRKSYLHGKY